MNPTVGRIVHYHRDTATTQAAIITFVHDETPAHLVNLAVFDELGSVRGMLQISKRDAGQGRAQNVWDWPPRVDG